MPKKTKREKLLAELHRKTFSVTTTLGTTFPHIESVPLPTHPFAQDAIAFGLIRRDVVKTVLLGMAAITGEILIYWINRGNV